MPDIGNDPAPLNEISPSYFETKSVWENFSDASEKNIQERSISLKLNVDQKDNPLFTKKGFLFNSVIKSAGFGGARAYSKIDMTFNSYFPVSRKSVFAMRIQFGKLWGWNDNYDDYSNPADDFYTFAFIAYPITYIGAIIYSFARGNKAFGKGLIASAILGLALLGVIVVSVVLYLGF